MSPRGKEQNEQMRAEAKAKISRAALEVFAQYGYYGTTMNHIMERSGLSKGLVYHYFPSKEKLFLHLVGAALEISRNIWAEALDTPGTAWEKIEALSDHLVRKAFTEEASLYFLIMVQAMTQGRGIPGLLEFVMQGSAHYGRLDELIIEAQKTGEAAPGNPDVLSSTYFALFQGYTLVLSYNEPLKNEISPEIFTSVLRNPHPPG